MKYIQDFIRNKSRLLLDDLSLPQKKAVSEVIRGLMTSGKPILRQLAQNAKKNARKQGEKYGNHLGRIDLRDDVELFAVKNAKTGMRRDTIIAYDLSDISKGCAKKMEKLAPVFDGSKRKGSMGYLLHGIGVNNILLHLGVHEGEVKTVNQTRLELVKRFCEAFQRKGIWVFDRGNDDKQFFVELRHNLNLQFIARLRSNRLVVVKKSGVVEKVGDMYPGQYRVYLFDKHNRKVNTNLEYTLTISYCLYCAVFPSSANDVFAPFRCRFALQKVHPSKKPHLQSRLVHFLSTSHSQAIGLSHVERPAATAQPPVCETAEKTGYFLVTL